MLLLEGFVIYTVKTMIKENEKIVLLISVKSPTGCKSDIALL